MGAVRDVPSRSGSILQEGRRMTSESLKRYLIQVTVLILSLVWEWCPNLFECFNCMYPYFPELLVPF